MHFVCYAFLEIEDRGDVTDSRPVSGRTGREDRRKSSITIVGIGNEFRGDDGVALFAIKSLFGNVPTEVNLVELAGDQSNLLDLMGNTDNIIIIDAVNSTAPAGTIFRVDAGEEPFPKNFFTISSHGIDLAQSIELARTMKALPEVILIYGIVGKDFSFTTSLSQQVKEAAEKVTSRILDDVERILKA